MNTKLEYEIVPSAAKGYGDPGLQMQGMVNMADYHFRVNAERLGIAPLIITSTINWSEGACRFVIEAPAAEESLAIAFNDAVRLVGLQAQRV